MADREARPAAALHAQRREDAEDDGGGEQNERDGAARAGEVPELRGARHAAAWSSRGHPPTNVTVPSAATRRAGSSRSSSQRVASWPATTEHVAATFAARQLWAATETVIQGVSA